MAIKITDDYGSEWNVTSIECLACHHTVLDDNSLELIIDIDETCPVCGDGALMFDGTAVTA